MQKAISVFGLSILGSCRNMLVQRDGRGPASSVAFSKVTKAQWFLVSADDSLTEL